ncbi:CoA pyrophosphatase [Winogradskyella maritima]|uniref:NUDIX hydrolase n=1 Tax=Winogradskyella maritima TaxID=1517766 RepID=A0ABV8AM81_9FLAO|nr:CoA pyrophosphatase [Winogradskyella maritima]
MEFSAFVTNIVKVKNVPLLGEQAHAKLSPPYRLKLAEQMKAKRKTAKKAAVMALFYPKNEETYLILILRKTYKGVHSAQVGFPGGKVEDDDTGLEMTALRETEEEVGVAMDSVTMVKAMSPLYIPPSNFLVHPFIGYCEETPSFIRQDDEVEALIEVKLADFLDDKAIIFTKVPTSYNVDIEVPALKLNGYVVWGATAMMLSELKLLLNEVF